MNRSYGWGLSRTSSERLAHAEAISQYLADPENTRIHEWIHTNLIILDSKAQSLVGVYSMALATVTIFYVSTGDHEVWTDIVFGCIFALIVWAIIPLARVSYIFWSSTEDFQSPEVLISDLIRIRDQRTKMIRLAVLKGVPVLALFSFVFFFDLVERVLGFR